MLSFINWWNLQIVLLLITFQKVLYLRKLKFYSALINTMSKQQHIPKKETISLEQKIKFFNCLRSDEGSTSDDRTFGLNEATIRRIPKKNESSIRQSVIAGSVLGSKYFFE